MHEQNLSQKARQGGRARGCRALVGEQFSCFIFSPFGAGYGGGVRLCLEQMCGGGVGLFF